MMTDARLRLQPEVRRSGSGDRRSKLGEEEGRVDEAQALDDSLALDLKIVQPRDGEVG